MQWNVTFIEKDFRCQFIRKDANRKRCIKSRPGKN